MTVSVNRFYIISFFAFFVFFISCSKENRWDCFKSTGEISDETRTLQQFDILQVEDGINVYLSIDTFFEVRIEAGKNLIPLISTEVSNSKLVIQNNNKCNWVRSYKNEINAYVTTTNIVEINHNGYGEIMTIDTIKTEHIQISSYNHGIVELELNVKSSSCYLEGSGDLILKGYSGVNQIYAMGNFWVKCSGLETGYTYLWSYTTGDCFIKATKEIGAYIYSRGNIYYSGGPLLNVITEYYGTGQVYEQ